MRIPVKVSKKFVGMIIRSRKTILNDGVMTISGIGDPNVYHALIVIFLEFFAWGLLTMPIIAVLNDTFPDHTFLMNGIIMGIKGFLSFLSAPLIGALSDVWGRKFFLLITVFFTCAPIPLMTINTWWFFAMISISGIFAVTFSVVFAYVADVTEEHERSLAYGLVSATFAASLVVSPALGAYLMTEYSNNLVVALATAIAILDVLFILVAVPESLPEKVRPSSWGPSISWEQADPFQALRKVGKDYTILMLCTTVFLSYLPEAGQYSCIFVYLRLVIGFSVFNVAVYIAIIGILSVAAQTLLCFSMRSLGPKRTIMVGLLFEMLQLMWYGFGSQLWMMWAAGILASISSITYPAISAFVSLHSEADKQGLVQGMVTGMRGLCNGLGPAMFGIIFYLFHVDLDGKPVNTYNHINKTTENVENSPKMIPGPPFVFGAMLVVCALLVAEFIPSDSNSTGLKATSRRQSGSSQEDEDLEDGEIASDDEEPSENAAPEKEKSEDKSDKIGEVGVAAAVGLSNKLTGNLSNEDNDFEKDLQRLKEDVERKKSRKDAKKRREIEKEGRRKRKAPDDNKNRKEKKRKVEGAKGGERTEEEDVDEDEMLGLCIRGASPTINLDQVEVWSGKQPINEPNWQFNENSENESDFDDRDEKKRRRRDKDKRGFKSNSREDREIKKRLQMKRKGKSRKDAENSDMICINFMKGNCNKGNDCFYSHAVCPPKKMELCKFYLMDCCAKRDKCLYLHEEFPCKFFHTGLKCYSGKKCKFSHDPLNSLSKDILLKHLETAPKEILGDFPRLSRDCAETMVNNKTTGKPSDTSKIPSLFDIQVSIPPEFQIAGEKTEERTTPPCSPPPNVKMSPKTKSKEGIKFYQESAELLDPERERQAGSPLDFAKELEAYKNKQMLNKNSEVSIQKKSSHWSPRGSPEMKGINVATHFEKELEREEQFHRRNRRHNEDAELEEPSEKDMCKRKRRKHEERRDRRGKMKEDEENDEDRKKSRKDRKKDSKSPKSDNDPVRLNEDGTFGGIRFKIINRKEIRKSSDSEKDVLLPMKIEKPNEFLSSDDEKPLNYFIKKDKKEIIEDKTSDEGEKFGVEIKPDVEDETDENEPENPLIIETNDDPEEDEKPEEVIVPKHLPKKQQELFLRIQAQNQKIKDEENRKKEEWGRDRRVSVESGSGSEAEVGKTPSPEPADENWYSSDDEDIVRKESPLKTVLQTLGADKKPFSTESSSKEISFSTNQGFLLSSAKPKIELTSLSGPDLSKINITELLSSIRQVTNKKSQPSTEASLKAPMVPLSVSYEPPKIENPIKINYFNSDSDKKEVKDPRLRDPRINAETSRKNSEEKPAPGKSIYDCANFKVEFQDSDLRFQLKMDSDERIKPLDSIVPFGDVDLRNLGGQSDQSDCDFDMRKFGLPFKPVPVHSAATEIDASLNSHPPINYKVEAIYIPRPDFSSIKVSPSDPQVKRDPRLRRLFRINSSEAEPKEDQHKKSSLPSDPRQRKPALADTPKSPTESPFSPKQSEPVLANQSLLNANLLLLAQLGLSAAAAGTNVFDPRVQQLLNKTPQELEMLRNQLTKIKTQSDSDLFRNQLMNAETPDLIRPQSQGLLPTPIGAPGMGLLGPAPGFMMPGITMPDPSAIMGPMGQMGQNPIAFDPRFASNSKDEDGNDGDARHFNRGFRNERRGRGSWRGNRDRNWDRDNRRHNKRDDRDRNRHNRDRDDRRERKRSTSPD